jgi:hypothetical protein
VCVLIVSRNLRDLVVAAAVDVAQNQWRAILLRQCSDARCTALRRSASTSSESCNGSVVRRIQLLRLRAVTRLKEAGQRNEFAALFRFRSSLIARFCSDAIDVSRKRIYSADTCPLAL